MKDFEDDDPMELQAIEISGTDPEFQANVLIEEFLSMGVTKLELMDLFRSRFYAGTHRLYRILGEQKIHQLIAASSSTIHSTPTSNEKKDGGQNG